MSTWVVENPIDFSPSSTETTAEAMAKLIAEITLVYSRLNSVKTLFAGGTAPTSPSTNQIWFDTTVSRFKSWNGSSWVMIESFNFPTLTADPTTPTAGEFWIRTDE